MFRRQSKEISLIDLLNILRFKLIWIIIATVALGGIAFGISKYVIEPKYSANISLYVYSDASQKSENDAAITQSEINASQLLANNYIVILESRTVSDRIIKELHLDMDAAELQKKISAESRNDTEILSVTVTDTDPKQAQLIANEIAEVLPDVISSVIKAGGAAVVDYAVEPTAPSSPNIMMNTALSAFCGALLAIIIIIIKESLNTKVKGEGDLEYYFDIPVIANIPQITNSRGKEGAYEENNDN